MGERKGDAERIAFCRNCGCPIVVPWGKAKWEHYLSVEEDSIKYCDNMRQIKPPPDAEHYQCCCTKPQPLAALDEPDAPELLTNTNESQISNSGAEENRGSPDGIGTKEHSTPPASATDKGAGVCAPPRSKTPLLTNDDISKAAYEARGDKSLGAWIDGATYSREFYEKKLEGKA